MVALGPGTNAWPKRGDESSNELEQIPVPLSDLYNLLNLDALDLDFSAASSCKLHENLICFSLIILYRNVFFCLTSFLACILPPCTLFFLTSSNTIVEVEKTGAAIGFLDPKCLCSTTLNSKDDTLLSLCPICVVPSNYVLKETHPYCLSQ
jgi:hypothetical protein